MVGQGASEQKGPGRARLSLPRLPGGVRRNPSIPSPTRPLPPAQSPAPAEPNPDACSSCPQSSALGFKRRSAATAAQPAGSAARVSNGNFRWLGGRGCGAPAGGHVVRRVPSWAAPLGAAMLYGRCELRPEPAVGAPASGRGRGVVHFVGLNGAMNRWRHIPAWEANAVKFRVHVTILLFVRSVIVRDNA